MRGFFQLSTGLHTDSPPQLRRGKPRRWEPPKAATNESRGWGGVDQENDPFDQHHPGALIRRGFAAPQRRPSSAEEGSLRNSLVAFVVAMLLALAVAAPCSWAQKPAPAIVPPPPNMTYATRLDRTAVWVGDQFHYLIIVEYSSDYEFVLDNLTKETVNMDPLQVVDVSKDVVVQKNNGRKLFVDLTLANFVTGESLQIPQFTLYYFQKSKTVTVDQAAAESLTIPGPVIGIRSTLMPKPNDIRDSVTLSSWNHPRWIFPALAWGCGLVLIVGLGREVTLLVQKIKARKGPDRRKAMEAVRVRWSSSVPSEFTDPKTCLSFYDRSCQDIKEYVGYYMDTETMGLTAEEMRDEMQRFGAQSDFTLKVVKVLEACERSRYAGNGVSGDTEVARSVAQDMREVFKTKI